MGIGYINGKDESLAFVKVYCQKQFKKRSLPGAASVMVDAQRDARAAAYKDVIEFIDGLTSPLAPIRKDP